MMSPAPHSEGRGGLHTANLVCCGLPNDLAMKTERTSRAFILGISARAVSLHGLNITLYHSSQVRFRKPHTIKKLLPFYCVAILLW